MVEEATYHGRELMIGWLITIPVRRTAKLSRYHNASSPPHGDNK